MKKKKKRMVKDSMLLVSRITSREGSNCGTIRFVQLLVCTFGWGSSECNMFLWHKEVLPSQGNGSKLSNQLRSNKKVIGVGLNMNQINFRGFDSNTTILPFPLQCIKKLFHQRPSQVSKWFTFTKFWICDQQQKTVER